MPGHDMRGKDQGRDTLPEERSIRQRKVQAAWWGEYGADYTGREETISVKRFQAQEKADPMRGLEKLTFEKNPCTTKEWGGTGEGASEI